MSLPNQGDGTSQGQLRPSNGTRSAGRIGQPNRARATSGGHNSRTESDAVTTSPVAPQRRCDGATVGQSYRRDGATERCNTVSAGAVETGDRVANETAYSLGSAALVGACGAFVAGLRNHAEIVRAHANRESPKPAARPFSVGSHSLGRCRHGPLYANLPRRYPCGDRRRACTRSSPHTLRRRGRRLVASLLVRHRGR